MTLGRSFLWLFLAEFLFYVSGYVVHMGAGRILGVEDYGRYTLVITITILIANLIGAGLPIAMGKFLSAARASNDGRLVREIKKKIALWQCIFMGFLGGIFFLLSPILASLLGDATLVPLFSLASLIIPLYGADLYYFYYYSGLKRFDVQSWLKFSRALLRMTIILALAYWFHLSGIIAGYMIVPFLVFIVAWIFDVFVESTSRDTDIQKGENVKTEGEVSAFSLRMAWRLAGITMIFLVLFEILISFDIYLLKVLSGSDELVGAYSAALTIARIPTFLFYALTIVLLPTISEAGVLKDEERARRIISLVLRYMFFVTVGFVSLLSAFAKPIVQVVYGSEFSLATNILPTLSVSLGLITFLYVLAFAYIGAGKGMHVICVSTVALLINLIAVFVLPYSTLLSFLLAKIVVAIFVFIVMLFLSKSVFKVSLDWKDICIPLCLGVIIFLVAHIFPLSVGVMFLAGPMLFLLYFTLLFFFGRIGRKDLQMIRERV